jgi:dTDP-4-dehydrorhamnose 3,5-epimerase
LPEGDLMKIESTSISDVFIVIPDVFIDSRGHFFETYSVDKYLQLGTPLLVQFNQSESKKGVLRGLHYQREPYAQGKLVWVTKGKVQDVAVDIRMDSDTFLQYVSVELSEHNKKQVWIPAGFAHGFLALSESVTFNYGVSEVYNKKSESGIIWNDPLLNIKWDAERLHNLIVSDKDKILPTVKESILK